MSVLYCACREKKDSSCSGYKSCVNVFVIISYRVPSPFLCFFLPRFDTNNIKDEDLSCTLNLSKEQLLLLEQNDTTLTAIRDKVRSKPLVDDNSFFLHDGIIMR